MHRFCIASRRDSGIVAPEEIRGVRTVWRLRCRHVEDASREIQHMQEAMTTMNVQLANVISDLAGESGQAIIQAILGGERNPQKLTEMKDDRIRANADEIGDELAARRAVLSGNQRRAI